MIQKHQPQHTNSNVTKKIKEKYSKILKKIFY